MLLIFFYALFVWAEFIVQRELRAMNLVSIRVRMRGIAKKAADGFAG